MNRIILDCDPGMDDSVAIILALKTPELEVQAITTVNGNYPADVTFANARKVTHMLNRMDVPVYRGMDAPLMQPAPRAPSWSGPSGCLSTLRS